MRLKVGAIEWSNV